MSKESEQEKREKAFFKKAWAGQKDNMRLVQKDEIVLENDNLKDSIERGRWVNEVKKKIGQKFSFEIYVLATVVP